MSIAQPPPLPETLATSASRLLLTASAPEARWQRWLFGLLAVAVTAAFGLMILHYQAPGFGDTGIDENAYLVGGKNFARHFTTGFKPANPFAYVGMMWIRAGDGWYYPKYPAGVPVLYAISIWASGGNVDAAYFVSPICATLAILGMFFLSRMVVGSYLALLATICLAANPTLMHHALIPNSHAPAVCSAVWGMAALLAWARSGKVWVGLVGGFLLGLTFTFRYSEGLLVLPLAAAALLSIRWSRVTSYLRAALPLAAWLLPVGALLLYNWLSMHYLTGYDPTHESTGFTWAGFQNKWEYTIAQLHSYGLFMLLPLGIVGLLLMPTRGAWRIGLLLAAWFVPSVLLYIAYYWGQQGNGIAYLRFFITLFPPMIIAAMWLLSAVVRPDAGDAPRHRTRPVIGFGLVALFVAAVATVSVYVSLPDLQEQHDQSMRLSAVTRVLRDAAPAARYSSGAPTPLLFADERGMFSKLMMHLQFAAEGEWYSSSAFVRDNRFGGGPTGRQPNFGMPGQADNADSPTPFQAERRDYLNQIYAKYKPSELAAELAGEEKRLVESALDDGRPVYAVLNTQTASDFRSRMSKDGFVCTEIAAWKDPEAAAEDNTGFRPADFRGFGGPGMGPGGPGMGGPGMGGPGMGGPGMGGPGMGGPPNQPGGARRQFGFGPNAGRDTHALAPPSMRGMRMGDAQSLTIVQVTRRPPATRPATRP